MNWVSMDGNWTFPSDGSVVYNGREEKVEVPTGVLSAASVGAEGGQSESERTFKMMPSTGVAICNEAFSEGEISVDVEFEKAGLEQTAEIILQYEPEQKNSLHAGIGGPIDVLYTIRIWGPKEDQNRTDGATSSVGNKKGWTYFASSGNPDELNRITKLNIKVRSTANKIDLIIDGVITNTYYTNTALPGRQVGLFAYGRNKITFKNFRVTATRPQAFVVMQFNTQQYEDLLSEVIEPVCESVGLRAYRASDTYSPGIVIADIARQIAKSRVIIAEITPPNPNVYYEVGYADALKKPIILIADKTIENLPFDVRPYRVIFYENSIGGKKRVEEELRRYLELILSNSALD
jgi:hypothetical protein